MLILTAVSVFSSGAPYLCILICGLMITLFAVSSLSDEPEPKLTAVQAAGSLIFAVLSGNSGAYLIFVELKISQNNRLPICFPPLAYLLVSAVQKPSLSSFPELLIRLILLTAISAVISAAENLSAKYLSTKEQIVQAVSATAVNELYQKKLNQELIIKNYLADKNARLEERENISRSIHNSVGHSITAAIVTLDAADVLFDSAPDKAREKIKIANTRIQTSLDSIRHAVRVLDSECRFVDMADFISELSAVAEDFVMDTSLIIRTDFPAAVTELFLPHEHTEFLTGALQELLSNGVRHGNANLFTVSLTADSGHIRLSVSDNGTSDFSSQNAGEKIRNGFGLKKLISYTKRCGGSAVFENRNGFKAAITLPLHTKGTHEQNIDIER